MADQAISKPKRVCQVEGCERTDKMSKGYCNRHYLQILQYDKILERTIFDSNEIIIKGDVAEIVLYNTKHKEVARARIDSEDVEKIKGRKWYMGQGYVATHINKRIVRLSNFIMGFKPSSKKMLDHKDRNSLNNRKSNLRLCTGAENRWNRGNQKNNTSGYKGVYRRVCTCGERWYVRIRANGRILSIGTFEEKTDAAIAYNVAALKHHGVFACLNEI